MIDILSFEALVIGSGASGMLAALKTSRLGMRTAIIHPGALGRSSASWMAGADFTVLDPFIEDSPEKLTRDILRDGFFVNDREHVMKYAKYCRKIETELGNLGLSFRRLTSEHGTKLKRAGFIFGWEWCNAIAKAISREENVIDFPGWRLIELIYSNNECAGGVFQNTNKGILIILSKHTIMATGGWAGWFLNRTANYFSLGEGIAAAARIGAKVKDMEFVQFVPFVPFYPDINANSLNLHFLVTAYQIGEIVQAQDQGLNPLERMGVHKREQASKEVVCLALAADSIEGEHGGYQIILRKDDLAKLPSVRTQIFQMLARLQNIRWNRRHNLLKIIERLEDEGHIDVRVAAHFTTGGIFVDYNMASTIKGLYAVGECRGGLWGAGRVYSACAQCHSDVAQLGLSNSATHLPSLSEARKTSEKVQLQLTPMDKMYRQQVLKDLRRAFDSALGPIRTQRDLLKADSVANLYIDHDDPMVKNGALILKFATMACQKRQETIGCHIRKDFPYSIEGAVSYNLEFDIESSRTTISTKRISDTTPPAMHIVEQIDYLQD